MSPGNALSPLPPRLQQFPQPWPSVSFERAKPKAQTRPSSQQEPVTKREPTPKGLGWDWLPPVSSDTKERRTECRPVPVPHRGGNDNHNKCADRIKNNSFPGWDVLVNGKQFDALVLSTRTLWEVKTDDFDIHSPRSPKNVAITSPLASKAPHTEQRLRNWIEPSPSS